ncbi:hypothetical protein [Cribrihabitans neustonicus]|uniref:hypothetical protein n=1 Tax=Cribrihabitans neustonicus TaxID=1429085 RepID=UPI003B5BDAFB
MTRRAALTLSIVRLPALALALAAGLGLLCLAAVAGSPARTPAAAAAPAETARPDPAQPGTAPADTAPAGTAPAGARLSRQAARPDRALVGAAFGYRQFRANRNATKRIDARGASWRLSNYGPRQNRYPFLIDGSIPGTQVAGGRIEGEVPLDLDWADIYVNSAAVMARDAPGIELHGWTIRQAWDGIRIAGASENFLITRAAVYQARDDAIENDHGNPGTISNSLFDGVFSGLSMTRREMPDRSAGVVRLDRVLMRLQAYPFKGRLTHQAPFKIEAGSPALEIRGSVLAVSDVHHIGQHRLALAWEKTRAASGNHFLNLSDEPLPEGYPLPGAGWTVLQGAAARAHWAAARAQWLARAPAGQRRAARLP